MADKANGSNGAAQNTDIQRVRRDVTQWLEISRDRAYGRGFSLIQDEMRDLPDDALPMMLRKLQGVEAQLAHALHSDLLDDMPGKTRILVLLHLEDGAGRIDGLTDLMIERGFQPPFM